MASSSAGERARDELGFLTLQFVLAVGLSLVLLTMIANLIVFEYGRGVVHAAVDEGVRVASRAGADVAECQRRATDALDDLLGGDLRANVEVTCQASTDRIGATASATFPAWLPVLPDWSFTASAVAVREHDP